MQQEIEVNKMVFLDSIQVDQLKKKPMASLTLAEIVFLLELRVKDLESAVKPLK